jgi:predicted Zn-ribbon and HTH transcriptional regulator
MICKKCGYEWVYGGSSIYYVSCPRCRHNIRRVGEIE